MLTPAVKDYISGLNDESLTEYVSVGLAEYDPAAVEFAKQVLASRNIAPDQIQKLTAAMEVTQVVVAAEMAALETEPLSKKSRRLAVLGGCFMLGIGLPFLIAAWIHFRNRGERRKVRDLWICALTGFAWMWAFLIVLFLIPRFI
jgi:hypothetical protein